MCHKDGKSVFSPPAAGETRFNKVGQSSRLYYSGRLPRLRRGMTEYKYIVLTRRDHVFQMVFVPVHFFISSGKNVCQAAVSLIPVGYAAGNYRLTGADIL